MPTSHSRPSLAAHRGAGRPPRVSPGSPEQFPLRIEGAAAPVRIDMGRDWRTTATSLGSIFTILVAIAALVYTNMNNADQQRANRDQLDVARQGQITDRFAKAVEQLGDHNIDVRLGGIYSLERIMRDSKEDHPTVFEILVTFIRVHAPTHPDPAGTYRTTTVADALAAVNVLGRRDAARDRDGDILDLPRTNLSRARLRNAHLERANLYDSAMAEADLRGAHLGDADLHDTDLHDTDLRGADLGNADLRGADLRGADLADADLRGADLTGARVTEGTLRCARVDAQTSLPPQETPPGPGLARAETCTTSATDPGERQIP